MRTPGGEVLGDMYKIGIHGPWGPMYSFKGLIWSAVTITKTRGYSNLY